MLLTVPVLVAASIGFGGAGGISSLASGPNQSSIAVSPEILETTSSIESLTATLPLETPASVRQQQSGGGESVDGVGDVGGTETPTDTGSPASPPSSGGGGIGGGSTGTGSPTAPGTPATPGTPSVGVDISNIGGGSGGQGLIGQLLHGLGLSQNQNP